MIYKQNKPDRKLLKNIQLYIHYCHFLTNGIYTGMFFATRIYKFSNLIVMLCATTCKTWLIVTLQISKEIKNERK
jgi:tryptophan-rich sensory protein